MTNMAPGWYNDGSGTQRWWDGQRWTEQTQNPQQQNPGQNQAQQPAQQAPQQAPQQQGGGPQQQGGGGLGGMINRIEADAKAGGQPRAGQAGQAYVVLQVVLKEKLWGSGSNNLTELEGVINQQASLGYRLHTISTSSSGSKGLGGGDRIQATMVFERI